MDCTTKFVSTSMENGSIVSAISPVSSSLLTCTKTNYEQTPSIIFVPKFSDKDMVSLLSLSKTSLFSTVISDLEIQNSTSNEVLPTQSSVSKMIAYCEELVSSVGYVDRPAIDSVSTPQPLSSVINTAHLGQDVVWSAQETRIHCREANSLNTGCISHSEESVNIKSQLPSAPVVETSAVGINLQMSSASVFETSAACSKSPLVEEEKSRMTESPDSIISLSLSKNDSDEESFCMEVEEIEDDVMEPLPESDKEIQGSVQNIVGVGTNKQSDSMADQELSQVATTSNTSHGILEITMEKNTSNLCSDNESMFDKGKQNSSECLRLDGKDVEKSQMSLSTPEEAEFLMETDSFEETRTDVNEVFDDEKDSEDKHVVEGSDSRSGSRASSSDGTDTGDEASQPTMAAFSLKSPKPVFLFANKNFKNSVTSLLGLNFHNQIMKKSKNVAKHKNVVVVSKSIGKNMSYSTFSKSSEKSMAIDSTSEQATMSTQTVLSSSSGTQTPKLIGDAMYPKTATSLLMSVIDKSKVGKELKSEGHAKTVSSCITTTSSSILKPMKSLRPLLQESILAKSGGKSDVTVSQSPAITTMVSKTRSNSDVQYSNKVVMSSKSISSVPTKSSITPLSVLPTSGVTSTNDKNGNIYISYLNNGQIVYTPIGTNLPPLKYVDATGQFPKLTQQTTSALANTIRLSQLPKVVPTVGSGFTVLPVSNTGTVRYSAVSHLGQTIVQGSSAKPVTIPRIQKMKHTETPIQTTGPRKIIVRVCPEVSSLGSIPSVVKSSSVGSIPTSVQSSSAGSIPTVFQSSSVVSIPSFVQLSSVGGKPSFIRLPSSGSTSRAVPTTFTGKHLAPFSPVEIADNVNTPKESLLVTAASTNKSQMATSQSMIVVSPSKLAQYGNAFRLTTHQSSAGETLVPSGTKINSSSICTTTLQGSIVSTVSEPVTVKTVNVLQSGFTCTGRRTVTYIGKVPYQLARQGTAVSGAKEQNLKRVLSSPLKTFSVSDAIKDTAVTKNLIPSSSATNSVVSQPQMFIRVNTPTTTQSVVASPKINFQPQLRQTLESRIQPSVNVLTTSTSNKPSVLSYRYVVVTKPMTPTSQIISSSSGTVPVSTSQTPRRTQEYSVLRLPVTSTTKSGNSNIASQSNSLTTASVSDGSNIASESDSLDIVIDSVFSLKQNKHTDEIVNPNEEELYFSYKFDMTVCRASARLSARAKDDGGLRKPCFVVLQKMKDDKMAESLCTLACKKRVVRKLCHRIMKRSYWWRIKRKRRLGQAKLDEERTLKSVLPFSNLSSREKSETSSLPGSIVNNSALSITRTSTSSTIMSSLTTSPSTTVSSNKTFTDGGGNKFFMMKIGEKTVLIPTVKDGKTPKAYVIDCTHEKSIKEAVYQITQQTMDESIGSDNTSVSTTLSSGLGAKASIVHTVTCASSAVTTQSVANFTKQTLPLVGIKNEPISTGYDDDIDNSCKVAIKSEPERTGYGDNVTEEETGPTPNKVPRSESTSTFETAAERIKLLKDELKAREEALAVLRRKRSVDCSGLT